MTIKYLDIIDKEEKSKICQMILNELPLWFGIPEANKEYCANVKNTRFIAIVQNNEIIGFISIKKNFELVSEIYVMGIKEQYHNLGIGKELIDLICKELKEENIEYLEVKTLDESRENEEYRKTRLFYKSVGFIPFDVLHNEWGESNPCLIMIKKIY